MENKVTWRERVRYWMDNQFSRGTKTLILWLGILSLLIIIIAAVIVVFAQVTNDDGQTLGFLDGFWYSMMRTLDAGTMGGDVNWPLRLVMFGVTIGGVFIISTLIGVLTSGVEGKLDNLRKGRSRVIEKGHTVILGWSEQIFTIISELVAANENQSNSCLVILGDRDKVEMEEDIKSKAGNLKKTRLVCRSGSPMEIADLEIVNLNLAKSIIILSPETEEADSEVIKTVLAIVNHPKRRSEPYHIVAEIMDHKNFEVAQLIGKNEVEWILVGDFVARVIAQTCRQSGLSVVYTELLDFGGDEVYFFQHPSLIGKTYGESLACFKKNVVMGLDTDTSSAQLNPPMDTVITPQHRLVVIAEDDDKIFFSPASLDVIAETSISFAKTQFLKPEKTLIMGWNKRASAILSEMDNYVAPESIITIVTDLDNLEEEIANNSQHLKNEKVSIQYGDITSRSILDALDIPTYDHVILLSYSDSLSVQQADARSLITLLHLRDIADHAGAHFSIVSEMLDIRNRNLADVTRADDFIVSNKLISLMMAQVSENKQLNEVFKDMFDPEGAEIYLKPIENYITLDQPVNFYTLLESARRQGETAIGYRLQALTKDASQSYGVFLNPDKTNQITYNPGDRLIVIAES
jgi:voltage-gated potassium channel Kch